MLAPCETAWRSNKQADNRPILVSFVELAHRFHINLPDASRRTVASAATVVVIDVIVAHAHTWLKLIFLVVPRQAGVASLNPSFLHHLLMAWFTRPHGSRCEAGARKN